MSKRKKRFLVEKTYQANYGDGLRVNSEYTPVPITSIKEILTLIQELIDNKQLEELAKLLASNFVYPEVIKTEVTVPHDSFKLSHNNTGQRTSYTYEIHLVNNVLETLVTDYQELFLNLLQHASGEVKRVLLNFSGLDLTTAELSVFDLTEATLTRCKLPPSITQAQLDESLTYLDAKIPTHLIPYWSDDKLAEVKGILNSLIADGKKKVAQSAIVGKTIIPQLAQERVNWANAKQLGFVLSDLVKESKKHNGQFQKKFLETIKFYQKLLRGSGMAEIKHKLSQLRKTILGISYPSAPPTISVARSEHSMYRLKRSGTSENLRDYLIEDYSAS